MTLTQSVALHRATICRQEAWLLGTELQTRSLLTDPKVIENSFHGRCKLRVIRNKKTIVWHHLKNLSLHKLQLDLNGKI
jgi:hypothetical protein